MGILIRVFLVFFISSVVIAEDATIPYAPLYKLFSAFPDDLLIKFTCKEDSEVPLTLSIQVRGTVLAALVPDQDGFLKMPLNEQWFSDHAVLHANRPKGTMTMTAKFVAFRFGEFAMKDGSLDLMEYLAVMKRTKGKTAQLTEPFKEAVTAGISDSIPFMVDPATGAKAILRYTIEGIEKSSVFLAVNGKVVIPTKDLLNATAASISVVPKDAKVIFLEPEARTRGMEDHIIP